MAVMDIGSVRSHPVNRIDELLPWNVASMIGKDEMPSAAADENAS